MNTDIQVAEGNRKVGAGMSSSNDGLEEEGEVDLIVMKLASEKMKDTAEKEY
jgi:hypothetical protein